MSLSSQLSVAAGLEGSALTQGHNKVCFARKKKKQKSPSED